MPPDHPPKTRTLDTDRSLDPDVDEPKTDPRIKRSNQFTRLISLAVAGGFSVVTLGSVAYAYEKLREVSADAGVEAAKLELAPVVAELKGHEARLQVQEQTSKQTQADVHEARGELRDLYKAVMEGKRSERLEKPLPPLDGGTR